MDLPPIQEREIRPCSVCAFFVYISEFLEGRCNIGKGDRGEDEQVYHRWEVDDLDRLYGWNCIYNISPEEIEESIDPWIKSMCNESMRYYHSAHNHRTVVNNRRTRRRRRL